MLTKIVPLFKEPHPSKSYTNSDSNMPEADRSENI